MKIKQILFPTGMLLSFLIISSVLHAQKIPMKFGKVEPEIFAIASYEKDTSASALILGDYGEARITYDQNDGWVVEYSRHFRARIFKKTAYEMANQSLILYHNNYGEDKLLSLKGRVYNKENGKIVESDLEKSMIHEEVIDNRHTEEKFILPNVREGSIIEYTYLVRSDFWSLPDWQFQHTVPALWSECRVSYPEYFTFKKLQKGYITLDVAEEVIKPVTASIIDHEQGEGDAVRSNASNYQLRYNDNCYRWVKNDVPAFHTEPYMNAVLNYLSAMEFELALYNPPAGIAKNFTQTWEKINADLLSEEDFGIPLTHGGFLKDVVVKIKSTSSDPLKQMAAAYDFIRNKMKWDERNRIYITKNLRYAFENSAGSSADINLLLVTLLKEIGVESDPVIISTRHNGMIHPAQIMLGQFNYVIASASIGGRTYLLDATEKNCNYEMLPVRCINGQGRMISEKRPGWIDLNSTHRYEYTNMVTLSVNKDGIFSGKMQRRFGNYAAMEKRIEIREKKDADEYIRGLEDSHKGLTVPEFELLGLDSLNIAFNENMDVTITDNSLLAGNILSFTPLLYDQWMSNPFRLEDRKFPVDFTYPRLYKDFMSFEIPEGYVLDEKPEDMIISLPDGQTKYTYRLQVSGNKITLLSLFNIGKSMYNYDEYEALKAFFNKVVTKQAERIVLKKAV